jgi:hypothetical protein
MDDLGRDHRFVVELGLEHEILGPVILFRTRTGHGELLDRLEDSVVRAPVAGGRVDPGRRLGFACGREVKLVRAHGRREIPAQAGRQVHVGYGMRIADPLPGDAQKYAPRVDRGCCGRVIICREDQGRVSDRIQVERDVGVELHQDAGI